MFGGRPQRAMKMHPSSFFHAESGEPPGAAQCRPERAEARGAPRPRLRFARSALLSPDFPRRRQGLGVALGLTFLLLCGCGYRFGAGTGESPFPEEVKTIELQSAQNNTTVTGIETELTNDLRREFALARGLDPVRSGGDVVLKTIISSYSDLPTSYKADGKELTRTGALHVRCALVRTATNKTLWSKDFSASHSYTVTDTIEETLANRRKAISSMIKQLIPRVQRSLYDNF